jgi:hypothetical protein
MNLNKLLQQFISPSIKLIIVLLTTLNFNISYAEDTLSSLMQRMKSNDAVKMAYQEIRTLELMDKPWKSSGYMFSIPPDTLIKEQLFPERILMAVRGNELFYIDPANNVHHQGAMDDDNPQSLSIALFKALHNGDETLLKKLYGVDFSTQSQRWTMLLKPKLNPESGFSIIVSGLSDKSADMIRIKQPDGDLSEFILQQVGSTDKNTLNRALKQLNREIFEQ